MNMKRIVTVVVTLGFVIGAQALPVFYWGSNGSVGTGTGPDILDPDGVPIPTTSDWMAIMFRQYDNTPLLTSDATFWSAADTPGVCYQQPIYASPAWSNVAVYTRIYNHANPSAATKWADTGFTTIFWSDVPAPQAEVVYEIGPVGPTDWVPEPTTALITLVGAASAIWFRRRRMEKGAE